MDNLEFQDLPYGSEGSKTTDHVTIPLTDLDTDNEEQTQTGNPNQDTPASPSIFSLAYYQQFFDVDTRDVVTRTWSSMVPNPKRNYLEHIIRPTPDLYGPFWICATLTFCIGIAGNVADFFAKSGADFHWRYDFHKVSLAATVIFSYWLIIPLVIWGFLKWRGSLAGFLLTEIVCVYGYSLAIFMPISILWLIPVVWLKYLLAIIGSLLSGGTLLIALYPAVKNDTKQVAIGFIVLIVLLHAALGTGFVLYFFHYNTTATSLNKPVNSISEHVDKSFNMSAAAFKNPVHKQIMRETQPEKSTPRPPDSADLEAERPADAGVIAHEKSTDNTGAESGNSLAVEESGETSSTSTTEGAGNL